MEPKIEVAFRIDENGILAVTARDAESGLQQGIRIEDPLGLQQVEPARGAGCRAADRSRRSATAATSRSSASASRCRANRPRGWPRDPPPLAFGSLRAPLAELAGGMAAGVVLAA